MIAFTQFPSDFKELIAGIGFSKTNKLNHGNAKRREAPYVSEELQRVSKEQIFTRRRRALLKLSELSKSMLGSELQGEDFAKRMWILIRDMEDNSAEELSFAVLQTKTPKRLKVDKDDESKEDESTKKSGKRRKINGRKGVNTSVDENDSEDSDKVVSMRSLTQHGYSRAMASCQDWSSCALKTVAVRFET
ncbi:hypothetical protein Tco_0427702 [Tanacetum coccineum]